MNIRTISKAKGTWGLLLLSATFAVQAAHPKANLMHKQAPRLKKITVEEYDALKREISVLKEQVSILMKGPGSGTTKAVPAKPESKHAASEVAPTPTPAEASPQSEPVSSTKAYTEGLAEGDRKQEAEEAQRQLDTFLRSQKLLYKKGQLQTELAMSYTNDVQINNCAKSGVYVCTNENNVVNAVPRISTRSADLNLITRYGVMDNLELDLFVPLSYLEQEFSYYLFNGGPGDRRELGGTPKRTEAVGLGDIAASLRYALHREDGTWPDVTLSLDGKSTTGDVNRGLGTGFWNIGASVTMVKSMDPVVLFGSVGYLATLENTILVPGEQFPRSINPGDQIPYSMGMGFSLNDRVSFRVSLSGAIARGTSAKVNGIVPRTGYDVDVLQFSTTIQQQKNLFFEPYVGIGLTEESPDFIAGIRIPYRFSGSYPLPFLN